MGLLDLSKEDEKRAINAGLLRAGLLMMQPVRGGHGKFAPQFSQGALGGLDAYGEARGSLQKQRTEERKLEKEMQAERRRQEAAADLANIYGGQDQSQPSPPQFNQASPVLPYTDMEKSGPARQQYGLLNPRGRIPNTADMENDRHEQMALNGMSPEERGQFIDVQDEYRNMAEMPNQTGQVPPIAQNFPLNDLPQEKPYPALSFVDGEIPELPQEEVVGMRQRQTEPIPRMPQFELRDSPTPGINPSAAPVRIGNNNVDWAKRYRVAQIAMENGVPGAKEALAALLEERKPKFSNVAAGSSVFNENTGKVEYTAPDAAYSLSPGEIRMRGDEQIAVAPERKPTQTELAKLMQEREELARINPSHPQLVTYDRVINDYKQGGGVTVNTGEIKLTESQGKGASFGLRAKSSDAIMSSVESGQDNGIGSLKHWTYSKMGVAGNALMPESWQKYNQAAREFISAAVLRSDSGATITDSDYAQYYPIFFPMPGDTAAVKEQKAVSRRVAIAGLDVIAGPGAAVAQDRLNNTGAPSQDKANRTSGQSQSPRQDQSIRQRAGKAPGVSTPKGSPAGTVFYGYDAQGSRVYKMPRGTYNEREFPNGLMAE